MNDLAVYEPSPNLPVRSGVPGSDEFDSWIAVDSLMTSLATAIQESNSSEPGTPLRTGRFGEGS